jgi:polar amino acid transport system substrate-binding protein
MAVSDPNVLIFSITRTAEREKLFHWVGELDSVCNHLWALKKNDSINITSLKDAESYLVAVPRDDNVHHLLIKNGFVDEKNIHVVNTREQTVEMLFSGRVDLLMGVELLLEQRVNHLGYNFKDLQKVYSLSSRMDNPLSVAFSKSTPLPLVYKFQKAYKKLTSSFEYTHISSDFNCGAS